MNKYVVFIACFFCVLVSCNEKETDQLIKINPNNFIPQSFALSDLASELQYIPLNNDQIIPNILKLELCNNKIFIGITGGKLLAFNLDGTFERFIGQKGYGPGEFRYASVFTIDEKRKIVYVLDGANIHLYSFDGDFIKNISLEKFGADFYGILFQNNKIYLFEYLYYGQSKYNWMILDEYGNEIGSKVNSIKPFKTGWPGPNETSYKFEGEIRYWNMYNDTIFTLRDTVYEPYFIFEKGGFRCPTQNFYEIDYDRYWYPVQIFETSQYIFINSNWKGNKQLFSLDKKSRESIIVDKKPLASLNRNMLTFGIKNDLDGGTSLGSTYYFTTDNEKYLVSWVNAFDLKAHVASEAFKTSTPKYPEKKRELEKLANNLNENDNPVLMLVKLKD